MDLISCRFEVSKLEISVFRDRIRVAKTVQQRKSLLTDAAFVCPCLASFRLPPFLAPDLSIRCYEVWQTACAKCVLLLRGWKETIIVG